MKNQKQKKLLTEWPYADAADLVWGALACPEPGRRDLVVVLQRFDSV